MTDGSTISSTTSPGLTPERKSPPSVNSSSAAAPLPQAEKTKKVRCLLSSEANISYSIQKIINRELINSDLLLRFDISPPVIQSLARLILKLDRGPCFHERNSLSDNNELFLKWIPSTVYHVLIDMLRVISYLERFLMFSPNLRGGT